MEQGCPERYLLNDVEPHVSADQLKVYQTVNQDVLIGKNRRLKWCSTADCESIIRRPKCCCKRETLCTICGRLTCFKCGQPWHQGEPCQNALVLDPTLSRYLLVAECIKCKVPITKNGACNHMTCSRCGAEFCWICRKPYRGHKQPGPTEITFWLGCDLLLGDTATAWLLVMLLMFLLSPFHILVEISICFGHYLQKLVFPDDF